MCNKFLKDLYIRLGQGSKVIKMEKWQTKMDRHINQISNMLVEDCAHFLSREKELLNSHDFPRKDGAVLFSSCRKQDAHISHGRIILDTFPSAIPTTREVGNGDTGYFNLPF